MKKRSKITEMITEEELKIPSTRKVMEFMSSISPASWNFYSYRLKDSHSCSDALNINLEVRRRSRMDDPSIYGETCPGIEFGKSGYAWTRIILYKPANWIITSTHELAHIAESRWIGYKFGFHRHPFGGNSATLPVSLDDYNNKDKLTFNGVSIDVNKDSLNSLYNRPHNWIFRYYLKIFSNRICKIHCSSFPYCNDIKQENNLCGLYLLNNVEPWFLESQCHRYPNPDK